jgi:hypothetical protein
VDSVIASIIDVPCQYDIIMGDDFLAKAGMQIIFNTKTMTWLGASESVPIMLKYY